MTHALEDSTEVKNTVDYNMLINLQEIVEQQESQGTIQDYCWCLQWHLQKNYVEHEQPRKRYNVTLPVNPIKE